MSRHKNNTRNKNLRRPRERKVLASIKAMIAEASAKVGSGPTIPEVIANAATIKKYDMVRLAKEAGVKLVCNDANIEDIQ